MTRYDVRANAPVIPTLRPANRGATPPPARAMAGPPAGWRLWMVAAAVATLAAAMAAPAMAAEERRERAERGERGDRHQRAERVDQAARAERAERAPRGDRGRRVDRASHVQGPQRPARPARAEGQAAGQGQRAERRAERRHERVVDPRTERRVVEQRHTERRVERHEHRAARPVRVVRPAPRVVVHTHRPGHVVKVLPSAARRVPWQQQRYHYHEGIWYRPASAGWVVVRPPRGIRVPHLPDFARAVLLGGLVYWVVNDVYYRELDRSQGYEVIDPLAGGDVPGATMQRLFIYPERGQGPEVQATDEYQCHRWAVRQTGFDPTAAVGSGGATQGSPSDYRRAQTACLEARGYSVR